jgi:hypothetical protein
MAVLVACLRVLFGVLAVAVAFAVVVEVAIAVVDWVDGARKRFRLVRRK